MSKNELISARREDVTRAYESVIATNRRLYLDKIFSFQAGI